MSKLTTMNNKVKTLHQEARNHIRQGSPINAIHNLKSALEIKPNDNVMLADLGLAYIFNNEIDLAESSLKKSLSINPDNIDALNNLGNLYSNHGKIPEAIHCFCKVTTLQPKHYHAHNNLGIAYKLSHEHDKAKKCFETAVSIQPSEPLALVNLGKLELFLGNYEQALQQLQTVIQYQSNHEQALSALCEAYFQSNQIKEASSTVKRVLSLYPHNSDCHLTLASILFKEKQYDESLVHYEKVLASGNMSLFQKGQLLAVYARLGLWEKKEKLSSSIVASIQTEEPGEPLSPLHGQMIPLDLNLQKVVAEKWSYFYCQKASSQPLSHRKRQTHSKIKIGYFSSDFSNHPVALLINCLFSFHDREQFEIIGLVTQSYDTKEFHDICQTFDKVLFLDKLSYEAAAHALFESHIDILIDLSGPTNNHYGILAYQPAKIQCHLLGFTGTTGASFMQYYLTHENIVPPENKLYFSEKLIYLPHTEFSSGHFNPPIPSKTREELGLPNDKVIYICLSQSYRIDKHTIQTWMKILQHVPQSILWLRGDNSHFIDRVYQEGLHLGLDKDRFTFLDPGDLKEDWLHLLADVWLDPLQFSSGTPLFLSLWGGLPFLTLKGLNPQARVAASYLKAINMPELIAKSTEEYIKKAIDYSNKDTRSDLSQKILSQKESSHLYNQKAFIQSLENAYLAMLNPTLQSQDIINIL